MPTYTKYTFTHHRRTLHDLSESGIEQRELPYFCSFLQLLSKLSWYLIRYPTQSFYLLPLASKTADLPRAGAEGFLGSKKKKDRSKIQSVVVLALPRKVCQENTSRVRPLRAFGCPTRSVRFVVKGKFTFVHASSFSFASYLDTYPASPPQPYLLKTGIPGARVIARKYTWWSFVVD